MFIGKNVVLVKGQEPQEYNRVYLEYGPNDPTESYSKTVEGKDVTVGGKKWEGVRPKNDVTVHDTTELLEAALAHFQKTYPTHKDADGKEVPNDPMFVLLQAASYGADLWERNTLQGKIRPGKPKDEAKATETILKNLVASGMAPNMEVAKVMFAAMKAAAVSA